MVYNENMIICRCEEITYRQIHSTLNEFQCTTRELKLRTRAGMGFCGGRLCRSTLNSMISHIITNTDLGEIPLKYQPPIRPVNFGTLGDYND